MIRFYTQKALKALATVALAFAAMIAVVGIVVGAGVGVLALATWLGIATFFGLLTVGFVLCTIIGVACLVIDAII